MAVRVGGALLSLALAAGCAGLAQPGEAPAAEGREMWIELSEPLATAELEPQVRAERIARIDAQQAALVEQLRALGVLELARVRHARNAVLVIMSPDQVEAVSQLPGVRRIVPAQKLQPAEIHPTDSPRD